ncbi:15090_t:CDS:1, partial [Dentiscutata erythropus]
QYEKAMAYFLNKNIRHPSNDQGTADTNHSILSNLIVEMFE